MHRRLPSWRLPLALLVPALLVACSGTPPDQASQPGLPGSAGGVGGRPAGADGQTPSPQAADLTPLPTPQTVLSQVPIGRADPFAPLQGTLPTAAPAIVPSGFRLRGVLRVGGRDQAFVQSRDGSGVLCLGARGRCTAGAEPLLPAGTAVVAIQPRLGCIVLAASGQRQRYCLQDS